MKTKATLLLFALFFILGSTLNVFSQLKSLAQDNPNFTYIDNFNASVDLWWDPQGSGSTAGIIIEDDDGNLLTYRAHETEIVNPHTGSTGSMKLAIQWNNDIEYAGTPSHLLRQHLPAGTANTPERRFQPGQALEVFMYGDGSGNRFRIMTRDGIPTLEGSHWISIDWVGWKRITWDYNNPDNVVGWVNGNGEMDGVNFYFDSFQITKDANGTTTGALLYFDDLRIVDPFDVKFNIADANGSEVIAVNNVSYEAGQTDFKFFPGEYEYFVYKDGHITSHGNFEVDDQDLTIDVSLTTGEDPEFTVVFTIMDEEGILITDAVIAVDGVSYDPGVTTFQLTPGFYNYEVSRELFFSTTGNFSVVDNDRFLNVMLESIPDVYENVFLSWDVAPTATAGANREEYYSVWVAEAGADFNPGDYEMIFEESLAASHRPWEYQQRKVEISDYQQKTIHIAFRHHNSTNKDRIVIDNVRIEGYDAELETPDVIMTEDFEGGLPANFDPMDDDIVYDKNWLPEGWIAVDHDGDGNNWMFNIRVEQDLTYQAHMLSQSRVSPGGAALTPDNWLITPAIVMPWVVFHTVTFAVTDDNNQAIADAVITIDGKAHDPGHYEFSLTNGTYHYSVELEDYVSVEGSFTVEGESMTIPVVLVAVEYFTVTFNISMRDVQGFVPGETRVYITGTFPGWDFAEPGTIEDQLMEPTENVFIFTKDLSLPAGVYYYKYFDGPSYANGEWPGDPNREITVSQDMEVNNKFGAIDGDVSVPEADARLIALYPNPAKDQLIIQAGQQIRYVSIADLSGRVIFTESVGDTMARMQVSGLQSGLYIISIHTEESVTVRKLQIVR